MSEIFYATRAEELVRPQPWVFGSNGSEPKTRGIDVSRYQGDIDYHQCEADGVKFVYMRCTVGDYYKDYMFDENWEGFGATNILRAPYLVVAPAWSAEYDYRPVSAQAHWDTFMASFGEREPELPVVLDCELSRNQTPAYISNLIDDLIWRIYDKYGRMPLIYCRGEWWNRNTLSRVSFGLCDLAISRYNEYIEHPWADNALYKPRDWDNWTIWQYSQEGQLPGIPDYNADLDWFNGTLEELLCYAEDGTAPPPVEPPISEIMYTARVVNCSQLRIRGGSDYPAWLAPHEGWLFAGTEIDVLEEVEVDGVSICCRFNGDLWAWRVYNGVTYLEIV